MAEPLADRVIQRIGQAAELYHLSWMGSPRARSLAKCGSFWGETENGSQ
jgi:hypothetical protein